MSTMLTTRADQRDVMTVVAVAVVLLFTALAPSARADSATVDSVADAGSGLITVTYTATSTSTSQAGYGGWYAYLAEEHPARECNPSWANYLRDVETLHEAPGSVTKTVTFRPF